jgi:Fe-S cluster assembly protein SufD
MTTHRTIPFDYPTRFGGLATTLPGHGLPWLDALREDAHARVAGLPSTRTEAWKYTNLAQLAGLDFAEPDTSRPTTLAPGAFDALEGPCLVFVNGRLQPDLSRLDGLPDGVRVAGLAETLIDDPALVESGLGRIAALNGDTMTALNTAFAADGCVIVVPRGTAPDQPVRLRFIAAPGDAPVAYHPRVIVTLEADSQLALIESHEGPEGEATWSNPVTEIQVGENAALGHIKLQAEGASAFHTALTKATLGRAASYESLVLALGASLSRNEIHVRFDGEGGECRLTGGYMMRGGQHVDNTTLIDHAVPNCASREVFNGVLDDEARGVFQGKVIVREDAQKSDGHQLNRTLLLSPKAEIDSKPELEIYADDVKCSHGATAGELDDDQLFYLRSRGLDLRTARALIVEGFMDALLDEIGHEPTRAALTTQVAAWIAAGEAA